MKIKLLVLLFFVNFSIYAQYTNIPDINFENKLIALGIDSGIPDGKVLTDEIDKLTNLDIPNASIIDLTGIQDFVSLTALNCSYNQLTSLNVSKNTSLKYLSCGLNQLITLDISKNTALDYLQCDSNRLKSLDISKSTILKYLDCFQNQLTALDVSKNIFLEILYCSSNRLTKLDVSDNIFLKELMCYNNKLTALDVSKNTSLKRLNCGYNQLTILNLSINLESLDCSDNQLTALDVSKNTFLKNLSCYSNSLTTLDVSKNIALEYFYCNINSLTAIDVSKNISLEYLFCDSNQLTNLNLKNGKNKLLISTPYNQTSFKNNPNLTCIQVDDDVYSETNWGTYKDATATYSLSCPSLGIEKTLLENAIVYPNPTKDEVTITNISLEKATVYNTLGQLVKSFTLNSGDSNNTISLAGLPKGVYFVYLINLEAASVKKVIVE